MKKRMRGALTIVMIGTAILVKNIFSGDRYFSFAANENSSNIGSFQTSNADIFCSTLRQYPITHNFPQSPAPYSGQVGQMLIYLGYNADMVGRSGSLIQVTFMENTEFLGIATGYTNAFSIVSNNYPVITFKRTSNLPSSFVYPSDVLLPLRIKLREGENKVSVKLSGPNNAVTTNDECNSLRPITVYPPKTDLLINSISYSPSPLTAGQTGTFTITYSNSSLADITSNSTFINISFQNMIFSSVSGNNVSDGGAISGGGRKITVSNLAPGETKSFTLKGIINSSIAANSLAGISGTIDSAAYEPPVPDYKTNNTNSKYGQIGQIDADLAIPQITASPSNSIESGMLIDYEISYQNFGPATTQNTSITVNFQNLVFESSSLNSSANSGSSRTFTLPNLGVSGVLSFSLKAKVQGPMGATAGLIATISSSTLDVNQGNNSQSKNMIIEGTPRATENYGDCGIEKIEVNSLVSGIATYLITLKNFGQRASSSTKLLIGNSANMLLVDGKINGQTIPYSSNNGLYQFSALPILGINGSSTIAIQMRLGDEKERSLSATISCEGFQDTAINNNTLTHRTQHEENKTSPSEKLEIILENYCLGPNDSKNPTTYRDLYTLNRKYTKEILGLTTCDIFYGYKFKRHTSFLPDKKIVRIEMIMALTRLLKYPNVINLESYQFTPRFSDAGKRTNVIGYLNSADELGLLSNYTSEKIKPYEKIKTSEAKKLLQKAIELKNNTAGSHSLVGFFQDFFAADSIISRGEAAKMIFDAFYRPNDKTAGINLNYGFNNRFLLRFLSTLETIPSIEDQITTTKNLIEKLKILPLSSYDKLMLDKETLLIDLGKIVQ
ncbi:MAG TPA: hypothetical protein PKC14_02995 [Candidatus Absconditabacterales bacterium]|nr:hypothetical protein [Candidatus Absconditabacterales bacterium]